MEEMLSLGGKTVILVPTIDLASQWHSLIEKAFPSAIVGKLGGGSRAFLGSNDILIAVINSARDWNLGLGDHTGLLIADECHHYGSDISQLALDEDFDRRLGLSATYRRADGAHSDVLEPYFDGVVFSMDYRRAIDEGILARFRVATIGVALSPDERHQYDDLSDQVRKARTVLIREFGLPSEPFEVFQAAVLRLRKSGSIREGIAAGRYWKALTSRRKLLAETPAKMRALDSLAAAIGDANAAIVFTQTIDGAELAANRLREHGISACALHSRLDRAERENVLDELKLELIEAVVALQVLDEGVDVPEVDLAVILAASRQRRQMVQRMGRILRKKRDGRQARFAIAYVRDSTEDPATGAHEAFLEEIVEVADELRDFEAATEAEAIRAFLSPFM
jgi:superfamily II DNA or RNA helicase